MIEDEDNFLEVKALGEDLAWRVIKLWMQSAGRDLNNYQVLPADRMHCVSDINEPTFRRSLAILSSKYCLNFHSDPGIKI